MDVTVGLFILGCAVLALALGLFLLSFELSATRRNQRAGVSLQLYQQLQNPTLEAALLAVRTLPKISEQTLPQLPKQQWQALIETDRFFSHMGELVRRGVADESVFTLMGPIIGEVWYETSAVRQMIRMKEHLCQVDEFDWLYEQWLNYQHAHRSGIIA